MVYVFRTTDQTAYAACSALPTDRGTVTATVNIPTTGTYRVWSRIKAPDTLNKTFLMQMSQNGDAYCSVNVGGGSITAGTWTWVDYYGGVTSQKNNMMLTAGNHTMVLAGNADNVMVDRIIFTQNTTCVPTGTGDNCADSTAPTGVSITSPANNAALSGTTNITAVASDNIGIAKLEFYADGSLLGSDSSSPYSYSFNPNSVSAGSHSLTVTAYDAAGNSTTSSVVTVTTSSTTTYLSADINKDGKVNLTDLSILSTNYGKTGGAISPTRADINGSGKVDLTDLSILSSQYGKSS